MSRKLIPIFAAAVIFLPFSPAQAETIKATPDQVKAGCNAVGGELLGFDEHGHYGCENHKNGKMVLCNKDHVCQVSGRIVPKSRAEARSLASGVGIKIR